MCRKQVAATRSRARMLQTKVKRNGVRSDEQLQPGSSRKRHTVLRSTAMWDFKRSYGHSRNDWDRVKLVLTGTASVHTRRMPVAFQHKQVHTTMDQHSLLMVVETTL